MLAHDHRGRWEPPGQLSRHREFTTKMMTQRSANPLSEHASLLARPFIGQHGVRALWRFLAYAAMAVGVILIANRLLRMILGPGGAPTPGVATPSGTIRMEIVFWLGAFVPALVMGRLERRSLADYGLPLQRAFRRDFWAGMLWGLLLVSAIIGGIALFHGYSISGLAISGGAIVGYAALWLIATFMVGLFEEFAFRGYTLFTLGTGIGFWPAAILLSVTFGAMHLLNANENFLGAGAVVMLGLFLSLTLRRTGSLWFGVGAHCTFDWGENYLYSVRDSGTISSGHLVNSSMHGAPWLTGGGDVGPEDSLICLVCLVLITMLFAWRYPPRATETSKPLRA
jgi:CAAX protease family protein